MASINDKDNVNDKVNEGANDAVHRKPDIRWKPTRLFLTPNILVNCAVKTQDPRLGDYGRVYQFSSFDQKVNLTYDQVQVLKRYLEVPGVDLDRFPIDKDEVQLHNDPAVLEVLLTKAAQSEACDLGQVLTVVRVAMGTLTPAALSSFLQQDRLIKDGLLEAKVQDVKSCVSILLDDLKSIHDQGQGGQGGQGSQVKLPNGGINERTDASPAFHWDKLDLVEGGWYSTRYPVWLALFERLLLLLDSFTAEPSNDQKKVLVFQVVNAWFSACCRAFFIPVIVPLMAQLLRQRLETATDLCVYKNGTIALFSLLACIGCQEASPLLPAETNYANAMTITTSALLGPKRVLASRFLPAFGSFRPVEYRAQTADVTDQRVEKSKDTAQRADDVAEIKTTKTTKTTKTVNLQVVDMAIDELPRRTIQRFRVRNRGNRGQAECAMLAREATYCGVKRSSLEAVLQDQHPVAGRTRLKMTF
jgi:hypothetical protein